MRLATLMTMLAMPLALGACDTGEEVAENEEMPMAESMPAGDMPMAQTAESGQTASAEGTVTAVDVDAGTVTIDHGPVPAVGWPAMTMAFQADEAQHQSVAVGDEVGFEFRTSADGSEIVSITKK